MKFKSLFILLIGMISFTSMACTPLMEQKPKATITNDYQVYDIVEIVQTTFLFDIYFDVMIYQSNYTQTLGSKTPEPIKSLATIDDVGWRSSYNRYKQITYSEKLHDNYLPDINKQLSKQGIKLIRNNC